MNGQMAAGNNHHTVSIQTFGTSLFVITQHCKYIGSKWGLSSCLASPPFIQLNKLAGIQRSIEQHYYFFIVEIIYSNNFKSCKTGNRKRMIW